MPIVGDERSVGKALARESRGERLHPRQDGSPPEIVLARQLRHVAMKVLRRYFVKYAEPRPLDDGPERLDAVRAHVASGELEHGVIDGLVLAVEALVRHRLVAVHNGIRARVLVNELVKRFPVCALNVLRAHVSRLSVPHADDDRLIDRTLDSCSPERSALLVREVLPATADMRLVHLDGTTERIPVDRARESLPDSVEHEPSGLLRNPDGIGKTSARDTLRRHGLQVERDDPLAQWDLRPMHGSAGPDAEILPAVRAPVRHRVSVGNLLCAGAAAVVAASAIGPKLLLEPPRGRLLVGELFHQVDKRDPSLARASCVVHGARSEQGGRPPLIENSGRSSVSG